jgi:hypothetical protein
MADAMPKHSVEVLTFRSVKRARDIFLTPAGPLANPHQVQSLPVELLPISLASNEWVSDSVSGGHSQNIIVCACKLSE